MKANELSGLGLALTATLLGASNSSVAGTTSGSVASQSTFISKSQDTVDFSALASHLKDDGLLFFNSLAGNDRKQLGKLVAEGKLSATELNDALSGWLKSARKSVFWEEAGRAQAALPRDVLDAQDRLSDSVARNAAWAEAFERTEFRPSKTGYLEDADAAAAGARFAGVERINVGRNANKLTSYAMTWTYAAENAPSEAEVAAAQKLKATGYASAGFDATLHALALETVNKLVEQNKELMAGSR